MSKLAVGPATPAAQTLPRPSSTSGRWSRSGPPTRPPKLPRYDEESGEEILTFVVRAGSDECYQAVLDMSALMKAEQPHGSVARTSGTADGVGAVYTQNVGKLQISVEVRKATPGRHIILTTNIIGDGEPKHAMQRWDFAPYHGDESLCQVTRVQSGQTLRDLEAALRKDAGICALCMGQQITSRAQDLYLDAVSRIKLYLEHHGSGVQGDAL